MRKCGWEFKDVSFENNIATLIAAHLNLLSENLAAYFSEDDDKRLEENSWIIQSFIDELRAGLNKKNLF